MILGIGTDSVEVARIEASLDRFGERFLKRLFTQEERRAGLARPQKGAYFAKRFAAKEAFFKALGTGLSQGFSWQDVEVLNTPLGAPYVSLRGSTLHHILARTPEWAQLRTHVSLSDTQHLATAFVVLEWEKPPS